MSDPSPPSLAALIKRNEDLERANEAHVAKGLKLVAELNKANKSRAELLAALQNMVEHFSYPNIINNEDDLKVFAAARAAIANETGKIP